MAEKKTNRKKHISYPKQREQCRLNKHTYIEKCDTCGQKFLMCAYPSSDPDFKKGFCKASTCTTIREIPDEVVEADEGVAHKGEPGDNLTAKQMYEAAGDSNVQKN